MRLAILTAVFLAGVFAFAMILYEPPAKLEAARRQNALAAQEEQAAVVLGIVRGAKFVFDDSGIPTCWVYYGGSAIPEGNGSLATVSCQVARPHLAPSQLKALEETERRLGRALP